MSKATSKQRKPSKKLAEMRAEYDLASMDGGVRGKYYQAYRAGHTVKIQREDGTTVVQHFELKDGVVLLEPDVREYFPDSASVNAALRCLIPLMSKKRKTKVKA
ncbi:hypothetical protein TFLX_03395 [Thermoflexales bacterium]|nr:hypothetical protein TFLX_03395 [Thermoflexales bacterium]